MPIFGFNGVGDIFEVVIDGDSGLRCEQRCAIPDGIASAACGGEGIIYYIPNTDLSRLCCLSTATGEVRTVQQLGLPHKKVVVHRQKVFCVPEDGDYITAFDPLCNAVEVLPLHHSVSNLEAADHGFAFQSPSGELFAYDFNRGVTKVSSAAAHWQLFGHYKRYAMVKMIGNEETISGVTETGELVPVGAFGILNVPFTELDGVTFHIEESYIISSSGARGLSPQELTLTSSPLQETEQLCTICLCEFDGGDGLTLDCGHCFHKECIEPWVQSWMEFVEKGEHISFTHAVCPGGCAHLIRHTLIAESKRINELYNAVISQATRLLTTMDPAKTADDLFYYICHKCRKPFYGGERVCYRMQGAEPRKSPADLICDDCENYKHEGGHAIVPLFKCLYCCNPATQRSFGTRYFCDRCSTRWQSSEPSPIPCPGKSACPFSGKHSLPPSETPFVGCVLCLDDGERGLIFDRIALSTPDE